MLSIDGLPMIAGLHFDLFHLGAMNCSVQCVDWLPNKHKVMVVTRSSEIYEISDKDGSDLNAGSLLQAHYECVARPLHLLPTTVIIWALGVCPQLWQSAAATCVCI